MLAVIQMLCFAAVILSMKTQRRSFNVAKERILYGTEADISAFPYQVGLVSTRYGRKNIVCGGALVKPRIVFTAAHCIHTKTSRQSKENLLVMVGGNNLKDPEARFQEIEKIVLHPEYSVTDDNHAHDFSIIILKKRVKFGNKVNYIPIHNADLESGTVATISGWGLTEDGTKAACLRMTKLTLEDWDKCQSYFPTITISKRVICVKPSTSGTYLGDSGGPLVVNGKLIGIVSFGRKMNKVNMNKTTVFTRVGSYLKFIEEVVPDFDNKKN